MNNAEIREANWPKLKSALEHQMMLCTSNLEQVQVWPFNGVVTVHLEGFGLVRCMHADMVALKHPCCARLRSAEHEAPSPKSQIWGDKGPHTLEYIITPPADMLNMCKPPLAQSDSSWQLTYECLFVCSCSHTPLPASSAASLCLAWGQWISKTASIRPDQRVRMQDMVVQISGGGNVQFQRSHLEELVRDLEAMRAKFEPLLSRLSSYQTDEATALMSRALEMMDTITNTSKLKDEVRHMPALLSDPASAV